MTDLILRFILFSFVHSLLATDSVKSRVQRHFMHANRFYRLFYNILAVASFCWVAAALPDSHILYAVSGLPKHLFHCIQFCSLILLLVCAARTGLSEFIGLKQIMSHQAGTPGFIRSGCYAFVRHPQYSLAMLLLLSAPAVTEKYACLTVMTILYLILGGGIEESRLRREFGDAYLRYQAEVPMFIPRIFSLTGKRT